MSRVPREPSPDDIGVTIETFLRDLIHDVGEVRAVTVDIGSRDGQAALVITAYTTDAKLHGHWISIYESEQTWVTLTNVDGEEFVLPSYVVGSSDGPPVPGVTDGLVTVYCDDGWEDGPIALEEGLERLRESVGRPLDEGGASSVDKNGHD